MRAGVGPGAGTGRRAVARDAQRLKLPVAEWAAARAEAAHQATMPYPATAQGGRPRWTVPAERPAAVRCLEQGQAAVLRAQRRAAAVRGAVAAAAAVVAAAAAVVAGVVDG